MRCDESGHPLLGAVPEAAAFHVDQGGRGRIAVGKAGVSSLGRDGVDDLGGLCRVASRQGIGDRLDLEDGVRDARVQAPTAAERRKRCAASPASSTRELASVKAEATEWLKR